jgi:hypothetical protein
MHIAFTLCSINYFAQAKTLGDSLLKHNPDHRFIIGMVDKNHTNVDLSFLGGLEVLDVEKVGITGFAEMCATYSIVELVTAVKPFYLDYLFRTFPEAESVTYFDPDIKVFRPLSHLTQSFDTFDVVLTPQITQPMPDALTPTEKHVMNTGTFNLGFVGMKRGPAADQLNTWWMSKLRHECLNDLPRGYFVDQLWMNLAPAYVDRLLIEKHPGYNMAHWNFHERTLERKDGAYFVNGQPLIFFHFSHFSPKQASRIASQHTRFTFETRPDLLPIYEEYANDLTANRYLDLIATPCFYLQNERQKRARRLVSGWLRQNVPLGAKLWLANQRKRFKRGVRGTS